MNIKPWLERVFDENPEYRGMYPEGSGFYDEIGCWLKNDEIDELREYIAKLEEYIEDRRQEALSDPWEDLK